MLFSSLGLSKLFYFFFQSDGRRERLPPWDELIPEALVLIFTKLPLKDKVTLIPCVCNSWRTVITSSDCWLAFDFGSLALAFDVTPEAFNALLEKLLRSSGQFYAICSEGLPNDQSFSLIADQ